MWHYFKMLMLFSHGFRLDLVVDMILVPSLFLRVIYNRPFVCVLCGNCNGNNVLETDKLNLLPGNIAIADNNTMK